MKIVIDIPDMIWKGGYIDTFFESLNKRSFYDLIRNGIPLPKGHGDLIDTDVLIMELDKYNEYATFDCNAVKDLIDETPTVIEADKGDNE